MKKSTLLSVAFLLLFLVSAIVPAAAQSLSKSDTIVYKDSTLPLVLRDFGTLNKGKKECHTIYLQNGSSGVLIIKATYITNPYDGNVKDEFTTTTIPSTPAIMLPNEIISISDLCFSPTNPVSPTIKGALYITCTVDSKPSAITAQVTGFQVVDTMLQKPCVTATFDKKVFGPIIMDGDESHTMTLQNNRYDPITVTELLVPDSSGGTSTQYFSTPGITFPYQLAAQETKTFNIVFSPRSNIPTVKYRVISSMGMKFGDCSSAYYQLIGVAIPPTADSISTALNAGSTDILAMIGDNTTSAKTFYFKNTGSTNLKVTNVALKNGKSFSITDIQPTTSVPFVLTPGQSMSVTITMTSASKGVYYDEVIITAENALISMNFQLQGLRTGTLAGVKTTEAGKHIMMYPNPSHGNIFVELPGMSNAKITVRDLLGRVVTTATASESWTWNSTVPAGTYLLQLSGLDASGTVINSTEQFIIE